MRDEADIDRIAARVQTMNAIALRRETERRWSAAIGEMRANWRHHDRKLASIGPPKPRGSHIYPRLIPWLDGLSDLRDRCYLKLRARRFP